MPPRNVLVSELGGTLVSGGDAAGFRAMQIRLGDLVAGMTIELLEPWNLDRSDFLVRFLDRHGDGPHHLTFKVPDLAAELERLEQSGCVRLALTCPMRTGAKRSSIRGTPTERLFSLPSQKSGGSSWPGMQPGPENRRAGDGGPTLRRGGRFPPCWSGW